MPDFVKREETRKERIADLYRKVLGREPDDPGLNSYLYSDLTLEDIEISMRDSLEYQEKERTENFSKSLGKLGSGELLLMGSSPRTEEHVESLKQAGIEAILCLDEPYERPYDHSWCKHFLRSPLSADKPIATEQLSEILDFIYDCVVINGRKIFIHSNLGYKRAPMIVCLFLVAEKKVPFMSAVGVVTSKQKGVNPPREMLTADVLDFTKGYRFSSTGKPRAAVVQAKQFAGKPGNVDYVGLSNSLFVGTKLTNKMIAEFRQGGIDVVVDLNDKRTKLPPEAQWFSHIHLPLLDDKIKEMMPIVLRNVEKYTKRGRVYVMCSIMPKVLMFAENYAANSEDPLIKERLNSIRPRILSL